jgi:putative transposase
MVRDGEMHPTPAGDMLVHWWGELAHKYPTVTVDTFVVMPNHIHALLVFRQTGTVALPDVMRWYKAMTTNAYIRGVKTEDWPRFPGKLWQRSYHDHIVRDTASRDRIRHYIHTNPATWHRDCFNR